MNRRGVALVLVVVMLGRDGGAGGDADYMKRGAALFRTGSRDPWFEGDANTYSSTKETANSITFGHTFLHEWAQGR